MLKAMKLSDILHFVEMWKEKKEAKEITYWNLEEMEAMNPHALDVAQNQRTEVRRSSLFALPHRTTPARLCKIQMGIH